MATNYVQKGETITLTAPAALSSGDLFQVGTVIAVAVADAANGADVEGCRCGVFDLSVKAINDDGNSAVAVGDHLYYTDGDTPKLNKKISGAFAGYALEAINAGSTDTINVLLTGTPGPGTADILAGAVGTSELAALAVTAAKLAADAVETAKIKDANVTTAKLAAEAVTAAKALVFVSTEQTADGNPQNIAHGLGAVPTHVLVVVTELPDAAAETGYDVAEGAHDATNVKVTATAALKYKVMAWA